MVRLTRKQKKEIIPLIQNSGLCRKDTTKLRHFLNKYYSLRFDHTSVKYWADKAFRSDYLKELKQQDELMKKWQNTEDIKSDNDKESYAEGLFNLAQGNLTNSSFIKRFGI